MAVKVTKGQICGSTMLKIKYHKECYSMWIVSYFSTSNTERIFCNTPQMLQKQKI